MKLMFLLFVLVSLLEPHNAHRASVSRFLWVSVIQIGCRPFASPPLLRDQGGGLGVLGGFSTDFVSRAFDLTQDESDQLLTCQTGALIVKLVEGQTLHDPCKDADHIEMLFDFESAKPSIHVNQGGSLTIATPENFPFLEKMGLSANVVKLDPLSMLTPCIPLMHPSS
ncbi:uncharacterized protein LOC113783520 isoform X1 [Coffea eugenioides]|uniref:uncharacterized protein LOC113783520 isoform X1 n=1 Tax=Coffea eugenioides TaxID=49369 RepID=UPI000F60A2B3|nr:uncharacterized protein LOC113783520 isoform X1 [Coffea eugenioides]